MVKNREQLSENENGKKLPENSKLSEKRDIQAGPEAIKKAKLEARKERLAFRDKIEAENSLETLFDTSKKNTQESPKTFGKFASLASTLGDRISGDDQRGALDGMVQSFSAPFKAVGTMIFHGGKLILSPREEIYNTLAYLKEESPNTEIV